MWRALKAELTYSRPWIFGGLGIAALVVLLLSVLVRFLEEGQGPPSFVVAIFPIIAGMVVSFVVQGYRVEERRSRLLLSGPSTPRQLAGVTVLLPLILVGSCALFGIPMIWLATVIMGKIEPSEFRLIAGFAGQFWAYAQLGPLAQESVAARRQRRAGAAVLGWAVFGGAILVLAASQFFQHRISGHLGVWTTSIVVLLVAAALIRGRTDFTR